MRAPKRLRPYLPNRSDSLALVSLNDQRPFRAHWPVVLVQIVGGKSWSISFTRFRTSEPVLTRDLRAALDDRGSHCPDCEWPVDSACHHAECMAPLDQIGGDR